VNRHSNGILEIGPGDLLAVAVRRRTWIAAAAALGALAATAWMLVGSGSAGDVIAGAGAGLVVGWLVAGWIEWGPLPGRR
jgi:hypothetical protein